MTDKDALNFQLQTAIRRGQPGAVESLLKPKVWGDVDFPMAVEALQSDLDSLNPMSFGFGLRSIREIRDLLDSHAFSSQNEHLCITFCLNGESSPVRFVENILQQGTYDMPSVVPDLRHNNHMMGGDTTWIHVSSTNGLIIVEILRAMQKKWNAGSWNSENTLVSFFYDHFHSPGVAPGDPILSYREASYWSNSGRQEGVGGLKDGNRSVIVFPYLALNTIQKQKEGRESYKTAREALPTSALRNLSASCIFHTDRTLDEVYYTGLGADDIVQRNADQVVSRKFRNSQLPDERIPILMAPQIWLWGVEGFMLSAYPDYQNPAWLLNQGNEHYRQEHTCDNPILYRFLQCGLIIARHIESFGMESQVSGSRFLPALDIFENEVVATLSDVDKYIDEAKPSSVDYKKERGFLHVLSDIQSELVMVLYVVEQQKQVLKDFINDGLGIDEDRHPAWARVKRAEDILRQYEARIKKINGDAERVEKTVNDMLNLKRTYASIKDTHSSLLLSTAVIGFTVITIIFAPLAFLTALFALKIDGFEKLQVNITDPDSAYKSSYMGGIFVGSEIITIALTVVTVVVSLWYIRRWDRLEEEDMKKVTSENRQDLGAIPRVDVESQ